MFLRKNPLCSECLAHERTTAATVVDHIIPHKGDENLFWDASNHRALCKPCHDARVDEGDFGAMSYPKIKSPKKPKPKPYPKPRRQG